jgi:hypothetical protein
MNILLIPRSLEFQLTTIWSNVTNNPTMVTRRNESGFKMLLDRYIIFNFNMLMNNDVFTSI